MRTSGGWSVLHLLSTEVAAWLDCLPFREWAMKTHLLSVLGRCRNMELFGIDPSISIYSVKIWYLTSHRGFACVLMTFSVQTSIFVLRLYFGVLWILCVDSWSVSLLCVYTAETSACLWHESSALIDVLSSVVFWSNLVVHASVHVSLLMFNFVLQSSACMGHLLRYCWWTGAHSSHPYGQWVG